MESQPEVAGLGKIFATDFIGNFFGWLKVLFESRIWVINRLSTAVPALDCPVYRSFWAAILFSRGTYAFYKSL